MRTFGRRAAVSTWVGLVACSAMSVWSAAQQTVTAQQKARLKACLARKVVCGLADRKADLNKRTSEGFKVILIAG